MTIYDIVAGKYLAYFVLVIFSILPTFVYYYSIYQLGSPPGNLDSGAIFGSYIGLMFLGGAFVAIGMFASALTYNQIAAFILGAFLCFFVHWSFLYISALPVFATSFDLLIQKLGMNYHYTNISRGLIETKDIIYFISVIVLFVYATIMVIQIRK